MSKNQKLANAQNTFKYLMLVIPLLLALIVLNLAFSLEQIPNYKSPLDKLFQAGLEFVIITSIASIGVEILNDLTTRSINSIQNTKIDELERKFDKKIDLIESKLTEIINEHGIDIHDSKTKIDLLTKLELLKSELEKEKRK